MPITVQGRQRLCSSGCRGGNICFSKPAEKRRRKARGYGAYALCPFGRRGSLPPQEGRGPVLHPPPIGRDAFRMTPPGGGGNPENRND